MKSASILLLLAALGMPAVDRTPRTVREVWGRFDARAAPLETEVLRRWTEDGIVFRHIRYVVGTFEGPNTRVAAFYALGEDGRHLPGIVQLHGGGQRARVETVGFWASHGFAALAVNWGELPVGDDPDAPNTDWAGRRGPTRSRPPASGDAASGNG